MIDQGETYRNPHLDWKALVDKAPDDLTYNDLLKEKVRTIEQHAMMKEKYGKLQGNFHDTNEANDMLIDALEAKLSILDRL